MSRSPISPLTGREVRLAAWLAGPLRSVVRERPDPARLATGRIRPEGVDRLQTDLAPGMPRAADRLRQVLAFEAWRSHRGV